MITTTANAVPFYVGDVPKTPIALSIETDEEYLGDYTGVSFVILAPDGTSAGTGTSSLLFTDDDIEATLRWPAEFAFSHAGIYHLNATITGTGTSLRLATIPLIVQVEDGWHTLASARSQWPDSRSDAQMDDIVLYELLEVTKKQCIVYAPALAEGAAVPLNYKAAQLMQARNVWTASKVDTGGSFQEEGGSVAAFPMDWQVTNLLRPKTAIPVV